MKYGVSGGGRREIDLTPALPTAAAAVPLTNAGVTECHKVSQRILKLLSPLTATRRVGKNLVVVSGKTVSEILKIHTFLISIFNPLFNKITNNFKL